MGVWWLNLTNNGATRTWQISNEIINRCCAKISLSHIFDGDVEGSIVTLEESIECGVLWKQMHRRTSYGPCNVL